jgi:acetylornithine/succinyldiaminopimelate/putrescine aminotransferase
VISLKNSFHGRTLAALAATGQTVYQQGFEPMPEGFIHVDPNDISGLKKAVNSKTAAILLEPIQGEGGVRPLEDDFLKAAREICDKNGILLMFDEVQVGMGRTGTMFAYEQTPVVPDVLCLAKALGNGYPVGAMLSRKEIMSHLSPGTHASTFGGNPVSCAAAKAVLDVITRPSFLEGVKRKGEYLKKGLEALASARSDLINDVRGRGLITAMEFKEDQPDFALRLLKEGLLTIFGHNRVLRLIPPLIIGEKDIDEALETIERLLPGA